MPVLTTTLQQRIGKLQWIFDHLKTVPVEWLGEPKKGKDGSVTMLQSCQDWRTMIMSWRKALRWTEGLDDTLSVMLAAVVSTKSVGDQLWVKVIGPPSCGKSTLCEAISMNTEYTLAKSTIRGFHSGFNTDGKTDHSLIPQIRGKTLITKDGDTLLQSPNLNQILSEARDLYDSTARTHYRTGQSRDYSGIRVTWLLCGTGSLRAIDSSELGERFLDCVVMENIDDELEDDILLRVAHRVDRNMAQEADDNPEKQYDPEMSQAMQLTGGYVGYLRENAIDLLSAVFMDEHTLTLCSRLGKFVAFMRARPSFKKRDNKQDENQEREFAPRLVSQLVRLAKCLAVVLNYNTVNEDVMRRVRKVTMDTAKGNTLKMVEAINRSAYGMDRNALQSSTNATMDQVTKLIRFLRRIGVIEENKTPLPNSRAKVHQTRWQLTERMATLYKEVTAHVTL